LIENDEGICVSTYLIRESNGPLTSPTKGCIMYVYGELEISKYEIRQYNFTN